MGKVTIELDLGLEDGPDQSHDAVARAVCRKLKMLRGYLHVPATQHMPASFYRIHNATPATGEKG